MQSVYLTTNWLQKTPLLANNVNDRDAAIAFEKIK